MTSDANRTTLCEFRPEVGTQEAVDEPEQAQHRQHPGDAAEPAGPGQPRE